MDTFELFYRNEDRTVGGQISTFELLTMKPTFNDIGSWSLIAPVDVLRTIVWKGGLVVTRNGVPFFSGRPGSYKRTKDLTTFPIIDTLELTGEDDNCYLQDLLALPVPAGPPYSSAEFDVRTGTFEAVAKAYVNANVGPGAKTDRAISGLTIEADYGRGNAVSGSARFSSLLALLQNLAIQGGGIGFRIVDMQFQVYSPTDRSASVIFSEELGNISGFDYTIGRPKANYIYLGGTGDGSSRVIAEGLDPESVVTFERVEEFLDQSSLSDATVMQAAIQTELTKKSKQYSLAISPVSLSELRAIDDYWLGDKVSAVIDGEMIQDIISAVEIEITATTQKVTPIIGANDLDADEFSELYSTIRQIAARLGALERK